MRTAPKYIIVHIKNPDGSFTESIGREQSPWWESVDEDGFIHEYVVDGHMSGVVRDANAGALLDEAEREERSRERRERLAKETAEYWEGKRKGVEERIKYEELKKESGLR